MNLVVDVQYACNLPELPDQQKLSQWVKMALQTQPRLLSKTIELTIRIVDATEGCQLNATWRQRPYPTNVLSFPFEPPPGVKLPLLGDIIICAPVVMKEAQEQAKSLQAHWAHLVIHGTLHLLGYDHLEEAQAHLMESLEINALKSLGYPNPYLLL